MNEILSDDIFQVIFALVIIAVCSMWLLPPDTSEKVLIGICSGLAGIAKGRDSEAKKNQNREEIEHVNEIP